MLEEQRQYFVTGHNTFLQRSNCVRSNIRDEGVVSLSLSEDVVDLMNEVYSDLQPFLKKPFAFFGHSMGALVGYEFARRLQREGQPESLQLFVSGCIAPHEKIIYEPTYNLPEAEFISELRRLQGTPAEANSVSAPTAPVFLLPSAKHPLPRTRCLRLVPM